MRPYSLPSIMLALFITVTLSLLFCDQCPASNIQDFEWTTPINGEIVPGKPIRVTLPTMIISKTRIGFQDLRVFNNQGVEVPHVIYKDIVPYESERTIAYTVKGFEESDTANQFLLEQPQRSEKPDSIDILTSATDFKRNVRIEGSADRLSWKILAEDVIFDYSSRVNLRKTTISLPGADTPFLRVTIDKGTPTPKETGQIHFQYRDLVFLQNDIQSSIFKVEGFTGHCGGRNLDTRIEDSITIHQPSLTKDDAGNTIVNLGEINLPLSSISLVVEDPYFFRRVEVQIKYTNEDKSYHTISNGVIHRIPGAAQGSLQMHVELEKAPSVRLIINNGDNPPLNIQSVQLIWVRRFLFFYPRQGETYSLFYGNKDVTPPNYDTRHLIKYDAMSLRTLPEWTIGSVERNSSYSPPMSETEKQRIRAWTLNALVLFLLVGLAYWGVVLVNQMSKIEKSTSSDDSL